jgi:hypothetical protein
MSEIIKVDFSKALVRCSKIGAIMSLPKGCITDKQLIELAKLQAKPERTVKQQADLDDLIAKKEFTDSLPLSADGIKYLKELYCFVRYGRKFKDIRAKQIMKGRTAEEDAADLIAQLDNFLYLKNDIRLDNDWLTGEPDFFKGESIFNADWIEDTKCSWDLESFMENELAELDTSYWWQMQGYFDLTGAKEGAVSFCLVNTPEPLQNDEKKRLFYQMDVATEENPKYLAALADLMPNLIFDDIPAIERRIRFVVKRDDAAIDRIHKKVERCRTWLKEYHELRMKRIAA